MAILRLFIYLIQSVLLFYAVYRLLLAMASLFMPRTGSDPGRGPERRLVVAIPAHNEEAVIGSLLDSLAQSDYPPDRFFVAVVADNCTDDTAAVARAHGAHCFERSDPGGKGAALRWLLGQLAEETNVEGQGETGADSQDSSPPFPFEGCLVLDADNVASPTLLRAADVALTRWPAAQGIRASKNPSDSWVSRLDHMSEEVLNNLVEDAGRARLGLPVKLAGSGMVLSAEVLQRVAWQPSTVTEDQEYGVSLLLAGQDVGWAPAVVVYDEKHIRSSGAREQRWRWFRGRMQVLSLYAGPLLARALRRADLVALDQIIYLLLPPRSLHMFGLILFGLLAALFPSSRLWLPWPVWVAALVGWGIYLVIGLLRARAPWKTWLALAAAPAFAAGSLLALVRGILRPGDQAWGHSRHARNITLEDLEGGT